MAGRADFGVANTRGLKVPGGRPVFGRAMAATAPANVQGPLAERIDVTSRIKGLIAGNTERPAASMFPLWDRMSVFQGSPSADYYNLSVGGNGANRVSSIMQFDVSTDASEKGQRFIFPRDITALDVYSGGAEDISDVHGERHFASRVMYEAVKAQVVMRLLEANRFGDYFSFDDIRQLHDTDGYFSWFAVLKTMDEQESFFYDRTNLALGAVSALSGGFVTIAQADGKDGRDRDTAIKTVLSKFPFLRGEFKAACSVFYTLYAAPNQSKAVMGVRSSVVNALQYLMAAEPSIAGVPFDQLDEMTRAQATIAIEETGHFLANLRRSFPAMTNWFLVSPLGQVEALPHPMAANIFSGAFHRIPERQPEVAVDGEMPDGRADITAMIRAIIDQKVPDSAGLMPEIGQMRIMQGVPDHQEMSRSIKDHVSGREYLMVEYEYTAEAASNPNRRFPVGIKHAAFFSGEEGTSDSGNDPSGFADLAVFKVVQLKVLARLLEANKRGNYFSEAELRTVLKSNAYIFWMGFMSLLKDIKSYRFDSNMTAGLALSIFLIGNDNFGKNSQHKKEVEQITTMLRRVPGMAEEYETCMDVFRSRYIDVPDDAESKERMQNVAYAVLRCVGQNDELSGEAWADWNPSLKRDCNMLYAEAMEFIAALKEACKGQDRWVINAPAMQYPLILPEIAAEAAEGPRTEAAEPAPVLDGDKILGILTAGLNQRSDTFLARISCDALEALSAFGGRARYWLLPEIADLKTTLPEESTPAKKKHASLLAEKLAEADAEKARQENMRLSEIKYAARRALDVKAGLAGLIAGCFDNDDLMGFAESNLSNADPFAASRAAKIMLGTEYIRASLSGLPENDPATVFEIIRTVLAGNLRTVSAALSEALTKGQRPVGLAAALIDFIGNVLDGKTMAVASYQGEADEKPSLVKEKYNPGLLDNISMAPLATALSLELREINGQIRPSAVEALLAAEKLMGLEKRSGCFSAKRANTGYLSESSERAKVILEDRVRSGSSEGALAAASALAQLNVRNRELDPALLKTLVESPHTTAEDLGYTVSGFRALVQDPTTGAQELLNSYMRSSDNPNWVFFSAYMLSAGMGSLMHLPGFDINTASAQEITAMLADAGIPTPERMTKLIISNRPYEGTSGFRNKKVNGLGQSKEKIAAVFDGANVAAAVKDIMFRALCSENPELIAMAVSAAAYLKEKKPS